MEIVHEEEQGFFVLMKGEFIYLCVFVYMHIHTQLLIGSCFLVQISLRQEELNFLTTNRVPSTEH